MFKATENNQMNNWHNNTATPRNSAFTPGPCAIVGRTVDQNVTNAVIRDLKNLR